MTSKDYFEINKVEPDYKDVETLQKFLTARMRIQPREKSGLSAKNQRKLSKAIKLARFLALVPYTSYQGAE
ncbi:MAG: 30S ribosomal protein S18 [Patescibacteria group bacterium]